MPERRPRIPDDLAERIDALRGNTPFERWVREALQQKVDGLLEPQVIVPVTTVDLIDVEVHPGDDVGLVEEKLVPTVAQLAGRTGLPRARCQRALDDGTWESLL